MKEKVKSMIPNERDSTVKSGLTKLCQACGCSSTFLEKHRTPQQVLLEYDINIVFWSIAYVTRIFIGCDVENCGCLVLDILF